MSAGPNRETRRALAMRFSSNVQALLKEKGISLTALGKLLSPKSANPSSTGANFLQLRSLPDEESRELVAKFLKVKETDLHAGDLEDFKTGTIPADRGCNTPPRKLGRPKSVKVRAPVGVRPPSVSTGLTAVDGMLLHAVKLGLAQPDNSRRESFRESLAALCIAAVDVA